MSEKTPPDDQAVAALQRFLGTDQTLSAVGSPLPFSDQVTAVAAKTVVEPLANPPPGYEILEELGRGGMGVVYKARHIRLNRVVALKMILAGGHAGPHQRVRFLAEAEAVAALQHPNIVALLEYGEHQGLPFFTLEFVSGGSLAARLSGKPQPPREAARLIEQLARGIHYAHSQGIVHRDLKPGNVLLDVGNVLRGVPEGSGTPRRAFPTDVVPKITDFGLARRVQAGDGLTASGEVLGTPSYMAPEQAGGHTKQAGPAADVYALGAILYECLTGRPPFRAANTMETVLQVMSQEPVSVHQLSPQTPLDLATICHRCLQKEPHKRYATALDLAEDCAAFLEGRPIQARPVGWWERTWRWCRRYPAVAGLLLLIAVSLIGGLLGMTVLYLRAEEQRRQADAARELAESETLRANRERDSAHHFADEAARQKREADRQRDAARDQAVRARQVSRMLTGMFDASDPIGLNGLTFGLNNRAGQNLMARDLLARALQLTDADARLAPSARAEVFHAVGNVYRSLGLYKEAEPLLAKALQIRKSTCAAPTDLAASLHALAWLHHERGNYPRAVALYREALAIHEKSPDPNGAAALNTRFNLAWLLAEMGHTEQAEELFQAVLARRIELFGEDHRETALARGGLAALYLEENKPLLALPLVTKTLETFKKLGIDQNILNAVTLFQQGVLQQQLFNNLDLAARKLRQSVELTRKALGPKHVYLALPLTELAMIEEGQGQYDSAFEHYSEALAVARESVGVAHPQVLVIVQRLAAIHRQRRRPDKAAGLFQELLDAQRERYGANHVFVADTLRAMAEHEFHGKNPQQEGRHLEEALAIYRRCTDYVPRLYADCLNHRGAWLYRQGQYPASEQVSREAVKVGKQLHKKPHHEVSQAQINLVYALFRQNKYTKEADALLKDVERLIPELTEPQRTMHRHNHAVLAAELCCRGSKDHQRGADLLDRYRPSAKQVHQLEDVARGYLDCLRALRGDTTLASVRRAELEDRYGAAAVACFRQVWTTDPKRRPAKAETQFSDLRDRTDFRALLAELEGGKK
jgi:tetratricopeptide (TPR) repeat protein